MTDRGSKAGRSGFVRRWMRWISGSGTPDETPPPAASDESGAAVPPELLRRVRQIEIRTRRLVSETLAGQYHSAFKGQGMDFDEVREYQPGDEVRTIDWNVTARMNHPFVKKFREERELTVMLVVAVQPFASVTV